MAAQSHILRIAVVQFCPKIGQVKTNIAKARQLCLQFEPDSIDILCFPEMAFTGYAFDSAKSISPYLENPKTGPSSKFYQHLAKKLGCYVAGGYPERLGKVEREEEERKASTDMLAAAEVKRVTKGAIQTQSYLSDSSVANVIQSNHPNQQPQQRHTTPIGANSAVIYGPDGEWVGGYRKTHLFEVDKTWAKPGTGFGSFSLPLRASHNSGHLSTFTLDLTLGICMDLNPRPPLLWATIKGPYELADHCKTHGSKLLLLLNAWLHSGYPGLVETEIEATSAESEADWQTLEYWGSRLRPLWHHSEGSKDTVNMKSSNTVNDSGEGSYKDEHSITDEKVLHNNIEGVLDEDDKGVSDQELDKEDNEDEEFEEIVDRDNEAGEEPSEAIANYRYRDGPILHREDGDPHETTLVVCNRTGVENGYKFAGSSAIFTMRPEAQRSGGIKGLDAMGSEEEGVRLWKVLIRGSK